MLQRLLLTDTDFEQIRDAALLTLERVGMVIQNETLLAALEKAGATVDRATERARIPRALTLEMIERQRRRATEETPPRRVAPGLPGVGTQVAQFVLDCEKRERRSGNREDLIRLIHFGDALHPDRPVGHVLLMTDVPPLLEPLEAVALLAEHAHHPGHTYPHHAEQFDYLAEIGEIWEGNRERFLVGGVFVTSPLRLCRRAADFMVKRLRQGLGCSCATMACVGASVPVTLAGALTVTAAEILGAWAASYAFCPEAPLSGGLACGSIDMRTGNASYCSPEAMRLNFGTRELFHRLCGASLGIAGACDYTDAKFPGAAAAMEKAFKVMTVLAYTGLQPPVGEGMLESGKTFSPEQLLIERDVTEQVRRLAQPVVVSPETLARETIEAVGVDASYLDSEHTAHHFRQALWHPELLDRSVWRGFDTEARGEADLVARAHRRAQEILAAYQPPQPDPQKLRAIRAVIEQARRALIR